MVWAILIPFKAPSKGELTSKDISLKKFYLLGAKSCYNGKRCKGLKKKKEFLVMANKGKTKCHFITYKSQEKPS